MASIVVTRDKGWADQSRKYQIFLNDEKVGLLSEKEEIKLAVEKGNYEVYGKIDFCKTQKIKITVENEEDCRHVRIYSNLRDAKLLLSIFYFVKAFILSDSWIKIKEI